MSEEPKCKICKEKVDRTSVETFVIITIKAIDKPRRFYLCEVCEISFALWVNQEQRKEK
ncbi:hypothetical protein LCGC14_2342770 [marine sediment metagenome]|uniref:Uncharacterized protein n=1 Tax=marine sediment metagenome TaxID=412755 RepID=A0A0F9CCB1_9ZZZZ